MHNGTPLGFPKQNTSETVTDHFEMLRLQKIMIMDSVHNKSGQLAMYVHGATGPSGPEPPHCRGCSITARRRDLYLTTHDTHNRQTSMPSTGFEPTTPAGDRPQTYALAWLRIGPAKWTVSITMVVFVSAGYVW
jgi:hypothetical protein